MCKLKKIAVSVLCSVLLCSAVCSQYAHAMGAAEIIGQIGNFVSDIEAFALLEQLFGIKRKTPSETEYNRMCEALGEERYNEILEEMPDSLKKDMSYLSSGTTPAQRFWFSMKQYYDECCEWWEENVDIGATVKTFKSMIRGVAGGKVEKSVYADALDGFKSYVGCQIGKQRIVAKATGSDIVINGAVLKQMYTPASAARYGTSKTLGEMYRAIVNSDCYMFCILAGGLYQLCVVTLDDSFTWNMMKTERNKPCVIFNKESLMELETSKGDKYYFNAFSSSTITGWENVHMIELNDSVDMPNVLDSIAQCLVNTNSGSYTVEKSMESVYVRDGSIGAVDITNVVIDSTDTSSVVIDWTGVSEKDDDVAGTVAETIAGVGTDESTIDDVRDITDIVTVDTTEEETISDDIEKVKPIDEVVTDVYEIYDYTISGLSDLFPFCIPFDLIDFIEVLSASPVAPCFDYPIKYKVGKEWRTYTIKLDLSEYSKVAGIMRDMECLAFIIGLIMITRSHMIKG